jgi:peroxiredoxin/outer membrane lipoprotein-sorting protein
MKSPEFTPFRLAAIAVIVLASARLTASAGNQADERADALLAELAAASKSVKTLAADLEMTWQAGGQPVKKNTGTIKLMKPNYALIILTGDYPLQTLASDGRTVFTLPDPARYAQAEADPQGKNIDSPWWGLPFRHFFTQSVNPFGAQADQTAKTRYTGAEALDGEAFETVEVMGEKPMAYTARLYIGSDRLLRRTVVSFGQGAQGASFTARLTNVRVNQPMSAAEFRFTPPAGAKLDDPADKLLAIGQPAPDFTLPTPDGDTITLSAISKGKRATLINFWYVSCPPCRKEFPFFQKLYERLKQKGFTIVAINRGDSAREIKAYFKQEGLTFPAVMGESNGPGVFGKYAVEVYPVSYLVDGQGRIVYRAAGVDEQGLRQALTKLGL